MALTLGWFAIRAGGDQAVRQALVRAAEDLGSPAPFRVAKSGEWMTVNVMGEAGDVGRWAQRCSADLGSATLALLAFEGAWSWWLFDNGETVACMDSHEAGEPALDGDLDRAASLLRVSRDIIESYAVPYPLSEQDEADLYEEELERLEARRAQPGDEFPPWDEWAHTDFASKAGIEYSADGVELDFDQPPFSSDRRPVE